MKESRPLLTQTARTGRRPFIHPIMAPDGQGVLTEDQPAHHPWQHGLYVGMNEVNGIGFWKEDETDGTFHPKPLERPVVTGNVASWRVDTSWRKPQGGEVLHETQAWKFEDRGDTYALDLAWTLQGTEKIRFGQYAYGGLFLRMPFREEMSGSVINSEGLSQSQTEGQRACWVAIAMPVEGRSSERPEAGMALMDHPANPEHPTPWRVDGNLGVAPSRCIAGEWFLGPGTEVRFHFRIFIFTGPICRSMIEREWKAFASSANR